jgi:hypothetical protein
VTTDTDDLTPEQRLVAEAGPDERLLVTAGPGTGKTYTLIARVAALVTVHGLDPASEILVLSFSRSAVREIRNRLATHDGVAAYAFARTFDSFATRLLGEIEPEGDWQLLGYDGRIAAAAELLRSKATVDVLSGLRHIIVDETQDLVAERSELVKALLEATDVGFTLFGDPAQGIYNFQLDGEARREGSAALYRWVRRSFGDIHEAGLTENFRARTAAARAALPIGPLLNGERPDYPAIEKRLRSVLLCAPTVGDVETAIPILRSLRRPTAILCRTNGEALLISGALHKHDVPHRLQQAATDRTVGGWVANALGSLTARVVTKQTVLDELDRAELPEPLDAESAWRLLKRLDRPARRRSKDLDIAAVSHGIRSGDVPDELSSTQPAQLVVSTIHRAKGLEFDQVIVVDPADRGDVDPIVQAEEARTMFVALSRPRDLLMHMECPDSRLLTNKDMPDERWVRRGWQGWQRLGLEVRGDDSHRDDPAGSFVIEADPVETQRYLARSVQAGDPVSLLRCAARVDGEERVFFEIRHDDRTVGVTSANFGGLLFRVLKVSSKWEVRWPAEIRDLYVEGIDTVAGTEAAGMRSGLGPSALWLRIRVVGLGRFEFDRRD